MQYAGVGGRAEGAAPGSPNGLDFQPNQIQWRNERVARSLKRLGQAPVSMPLSDLVRVLPASVSQQAAADERIFFWKEIRRRFRRVLRKRGRPIYFVTVILPEWKVRPGRLQASDFEQLRAWFARRARKLVPHGFLRAAGVIDVSFNDFSEDYAAGVQGASQAPHWQLHIHFMADFGAPKAYDVETLMRDVFAGDGDEASAIRSRVVVKRLASLEDVDRVAGYVSSKILADCGQRRVGDVDADGVARTFNKALKLGQFDELIKVRLSLRSRDVWLFSGLRRDGDKVRRTAQSRQRQRALNYFVSGHRKGLDRARRAHRKIR